MDLQDDETAAKAAFRTWATIVGYETHWNDCPEKERAAWRAVVVELDRNLLADLVQEQHQVLMQMVSDEPSEDYSSFGAEETTKPDRPKGEN